MKYIRTKDGQLLIPEWGRETNIAVCTNHGWVYKKDIIKQADTVEELCDEIVLSSYFKKTDYTDYKVLPISQWLNRGKSASLRLKEKITDINYLGAIWIKGEHDEPILKSVAKMKGILPNGEIDWELL